MSDFETSTIELLTNHEERIGSMEQKLENFRASLILAMKQSGIDLVKAMKFVESRVPSRDVPVAAEPVLTANQKLKPGPSGIIAPPPGGGGDGRDRGRTISFVYRADGGPGDGG
jgi:hypothetical protein